MFLSCFSFVGSVYSSTPQYTHSDSLKVVDVLRRAATQRSGTNMMLYFSRQFLGCPYVANTLDKNAEEKLVINLRQFDCTTFVENIVALFLCHKNKKNTFADFCHYIQQLRYKGGKISYPSRLHYYSEWIASNTQSGVVKEVNSPTPPFSKLQKLCVNYMSKHPQRYPMLVKHPSWVKEISEMEDELNGREYRHIPKSDIENSDVFRKAISDGDILAITTNKPGLDTSHIGIAVWHKDGLHLINASLVRHRVVEESMTLYKYMQRHPSQTGIRVIHVQ
jgi:hypothetical protein